MKLKTLLNRAEVVYSLYGERPIGFDVFFRKYTIHEERRKDMTTNEEKLKESLETRRPVLFLGAGFSLNANSGSGCPLMLGSALAK